MKMLIWLVVLGGCAAAGAADAQAELQNAKAALEAGRFTEARQGLARIQAFYYRDAELMPEALYYEALIDHQTGNSGATVTALDELYALYPASQWREKAQETFGE